MIMFMFIFLIVLLIMLTFYLKTTTEKNLGIDVSKYYYYSTENKTNFLGFNFKKTTTEKTSGIDVSDYYYYSTETKSNFLGFNFKKTTFNNSTKLCTLFFNESGSKNITFCFYGYNILSINKYKSSIVDSFNFKFFCVGMKKNNIIIDYVIKNNFFVTLFNYKVFACCKVECLPR